MRGRWLVCAGYAYVMAIVMATGMVTVYAHDGSTVCSQVLHYLHHELSSRREEEMASDPGSALASAFLATNGHLERLATQRPVAVDARQSGCCALVLYMRDGKLYVAARLT
jgi:hypothetical protein